MPWPGCRPALMAVANDCVATAGAALSLELATPTAARKTRARCLVLRRKAAEQRRQGWRVHAVPSGRVFFRQAQGQQRAFGRRGQPLRGQGWRTNWSVESLQTDRAARICQPEQPTRYIFRFRPPSGAAFSPQSRCAAPMPRGTRRRPDEHSWASRYWRRKKAVSCGSASG